MSPQRKRIFTAGPMLPRAFTTDTRINAEVAPMNRAMFGQRWVGDLLQQLMELSEPERGAALDAMRAVLNACDAYAQGVASSEMGAGPNESFATGAQCKRPEKEFGTTDHGAVQVFNSGAAPPSTRGSKPISVADVQMANAKFWRSQQLPCEVNTVPVQG